MIDYLLTIHLYMLLVIKIELVLRIHYVGMLKSIGHLTDFAFVKGMQMFKTTQVILEKCVYISRKEISSGL